MWIKCLTLLLLPLMVWAGDDKPPKTLKQKLDNQLEGFRGGKPPNAGIIDSYYARHKFRKLTPTEVKAARELIVKAECHWSDDEFQQGRPQVNRIAPSPKCKTKNKQIHMCYGRIQCDIGKSVPKSPLAMSFYADGRCFSIAAECPSAQKCALQSQYDYADESTLNDRGFTNYDWMWGYENDK